MSVRLAQFAIVSAFFVFPFDASAAIFRIQSRDPDSGNYNYGAATFIDTTPNPDVTYSITGEFRYSTDYKGVGGVDVSVTKEITAWNILVTGTGYTQRYAFGYNSPELGNIANTSQLASSTSTSFKLNCSIAGQCGNLTDSIQLTFGADFNTRAGDSNFASTSNRNFLTSLTASINGATITASSPATLLGQADFVPFQSAFLAFSPAVLLLRRLLRKGIPA